MNRVIEGDVAVGELDPPCQIWGVGANEGQRWGQAKGGCVVRRRTESERERCVLVCLCVWSFAVSGASFHLWMLLGVRCRTGDVAETALLAVHFTLLVA